MSKPQEHQACSHFATLFAGHLARAVSSACNATWQIEVADPQSEPLPVLESPVLYRFHLGEGLSGGFYFVVGQADALVFTGAGSAEAKARRKAGGKRTAAEGAQPVLDHALALQPLVEEVLRSFPGSLSGHLGEQQGQITIEAAPCSALDPLAVFGLELRARNDTGVGAVLLLHFEPPLLEALAALHPELARGIEEGSMSQANLNLVMDVELSCTLRFGQRQLSLREILDLASGSVVELDREVDEPVELILDGKVIARGEAVIIDGNYGLRVTQVVQSVVY